MAPSDNQALDDGLLRRYLLGALPEADAERLHELSVADDAFAARLDAIENDLVDAYVRGELSEENLKEFKSFYLSSPRRREKVGIAEGFRALELKAAAQAVKPGPETAVPFAPQREPSTDRPTWRTLAVPRFAFQWGFAAACLALLVAASYLLFENAELRKQVSQSQAQQGVVDRHERELEQQVDRERAGKDEALREVERARESQTNLDQLKTVSVLLPPPMRGAGPIPTVSLHPGTDLVVLVLPLEADDFPAYQAKLKDPATNRVLWNSTRLTATPGGERKAVSISFRAGLLRPQNYLVDLKGLPASGPAEVIGSYSFRVVLK